MRLAGWALAVVEAAGALVCARAHPCERCYEAWSRGQDEVVKREVGFTEPYRILVRSRVAHVRAEVLRIPNGRRKALIAGFAFYATSLFYTRRGVWG